jgi:crotonobetainyl-CoA:carnitine CoA-transferase CaiB-like acyl-CoA transferase
MGNKKEMLLTGLRILDLTDEKAGFCSKLLADMGARVIKVERLGGGVSRKSGPFADNIPDPEKSLSFFFNNTGKSGITLDIEHKEGRKIFLELVKRNDAIVESFSPGYLATLDLDFESLIRTNPKIILVSVTGFGQAGPRRDHQACDLVAAAFGGQMAVTGSDTPLKHYGEQSYLTASLFAAIGILIAVRKQRRTGKGEHLDISIQEAVTATLEHVMVRFFYEQSISKRQGSLHWDNRFHIFPCKDGFIQMTLFDKWETLVEWVDSEGMAQDLKDKQYNAENFRVRQLDHIIAVLGKWTQTHTKSELFELGQLMQFPWAPVQSPREVVESPQLIARDFFQDTDQTKKNILKKCPRIPFTLNPSHSSPIKPAPCIGEDNVQIYHKELGLSQKELNQLASQGVI